MANHTFVKDNEFNTEFEVAGGLMSLKLQASIVKDGTGALGVDITGLSIASTDGGNLLTVGSDGGAFFNQAALEAAQTAWTGSSAGFLTVTPAGTSGHAPTFAIDYTDPLFVEGVQDAVGTAILAGAGITYDDVADSISSTLGNLTFGNGLSNAGGTVVVVSDTGAQIPVQVTAQGLSVDLADITALATEVACDLAGNQLFRAFPA